MLEELKNLCVKYENSTGFDRLVRTVTCMLIACIHTGEFQHLHEVLDNIAKNAIDKHNAKSK